MADLGSDGFFGTNPTFGAPPPLAHRMADAGVPTSWIDVAEENFILQTGVAGGIPTCRRDARSPVVYPAAHFHRSAAYNRENISDTTQNSFVLYRTQRLEYHWG